MKSHPILFNGDMVRAILAGTKTQTRRPIKPQPNPVGSYVESVPGDGPAFISWMDVPDIDRLVGPAPKCHTSRAPYNVGDTLWVRETHMIGRGHASDSYPQIVYRADGAIHDHDGRAVCPTPSGHATIKDGGWKPSIHMPRWASRLTLRVTDVRVQALQDISEDDARADGVPTPTVRCDQPIAGDVRSRSFVTHPHVAQFAIVWDGIYRDCGWRANPWVWAITFEVVR